MNGMTMNSSPMPGMVNGTSMPGMANGTSMPGMANGTSMPGMGGGMMMNDPSMPGMGGGMMMNDTSMPGMGMMMQMFFHTGIMEYILFEKLHTETKSQFAGACVSIFLLALVYEGLKFLREELLRHHNVRVANAMLHGTPEEKGVILSTTGQMFSQTHVIQTLLHAVQIFLSYCLMLVFMTYNVYLCISLILGATLGYFLTGWKRTQVADQNEHCH